MLERIRHQELVVWVIYTNTVVKYEYQHYTSVHLSLTDFKGGSGAGGKRGRLHPGKITSLSHIETDAHIHTDVQLRVTSTRKSMCLDCGSKLVQVIQFPLNSSTVGKPISCILKTSQYHIVPAEHVTLTAGLLVVPKVFRRK